MQLASIVCDEVLLAVVAADAPLPRRAAVSIDTAAGLRGRLASLNIAMPGPKGDSAVASLVLLEVPGLRGMRVECVQLIDPNSSEPAGRRIALPPPEVTPGQLIDAIAENTVPHAEQILDFLLNEGWLRSAALRGAARGRRLFHALLGRTASRDGLVEAVLRLRGADVLVQARATRLDAGVRYVVTETAGLAVRSCEVASMVDVDAHRNGRGFVLLIASSLDLHPNQLHRVYFRNAQGWFVLEVPEDVVLLEGPLAMAHARELIPRLHAPDSITTRLSELARPRYEGRNTLTEMAALPVRMAVDRALSSTQGVLLIGWLLDPRQLVACVKIISDSGLDLRLDLIWQRGQRSDVSSAFAGDAPFAGLLVPGKDRHGFFVHVPHVGPEHLDAEFHIELGLRDGTIAFVPLVVRSCVSRADLEPVLEQFNPQDRNAAGQLEQHLAPFARAACADSYAALESNVVEAVGPAPALGDFAVLLHVTGALAQLDTCLAQLAVHGDTHGRPFIVVLAESMDAGLTRRASRLAEFYGHSALLLGCDERLDRVCALQLAADYAETDWLLALAPDTYAGAPGWVAALQSGANGTSGLDFVSPSLVYEDGSIRFAGRVPPAPVNPGALLCGQLPSALRSNYEGYPRTWIERAAKGSAPQPTPGASLLCCLMRKAAFTSVAKSTAVYVGADAREALFWEHAVQGGFASAWLPDVELTALDESLESAPEHWRTSASIVDRWNLAVDLNERAAGQVR